MSNQPVNAALNAAQRGVASNQAMVQSQNAAINGQNVSKNLQNANVTANRTVNSYLTTAKNLRKANMNGAANSFENAAKLAATGRGVDAAKLAGKGLNKMLKNTTS
jgi:hypothetical protein